MLLVSFDSEVRKRTYRKNDANFGIGTLASKSAGGERSMTLRSTEIRLFARASSCVRAPPIEHGGNGQQQQRDGVKRRRRDAVEREHRHVEDRQRRGGRQQNGEWAPLPRSQENRAAE